MTPTPLKTFIHPHNVYRLEYPAHWEQVVQKEGESCGFGPHERDNVGLWISIMPLVCDTTKMHEDLRGLFEQSLAQTKAVNLRRDFTLRNFGLIADMTEEGQGGHYWIVAGGDAVLFASTQVPIAERDTWDPLFAQVMASLKITRDEELFDRQVGFDVLEELRKQHPDEDFSFNDQGKIRGKNQEVFLGNVTREVRAARKRRAKIIAEFAQKLRTPTAQELGLEDWPQVKERIVPVLKPRDYVKDEGRTRHLFLTEWLEDIVICYVIRSKDILRFVTGWDVDRWELTAETLHEQAIANLAKLTWPKQLVGSRGGREGGRIIVVDTDDNLSSSRLLHPDLHKMFAPVLGSTFYAGVPCRDTLVLYSNRRELKQRIARRLRKDYNASAYQITPDPFLVTRDGVAPTPK